MLLGATPTHIYLAPHPALRPYIAHYTLCLPAPLVASSHRLTLIPDASGCLVLDLDGSLAARMYGPTTRTVTVTNDLGLFPRFFVEFLPGGLYAFTGLPQWELSDKVLPLDAAHPALYALLCRSFLQAGDLDGLVLAVDQGLRAALAAPASAAGILALLSAAPRTDLAAATGYSPRHLSRLFREGVGMGCKSYLRVQRVNAAVRRLSAGAPSLTRLAQELGYFDQAHFIHDFKSVCGVTPGTYRAGLSDFYKEPLKL